MGDYEHFTRAELISRLRKLEAAAAGLSPAPSQTEFPVFGERERREFDVSPHPIRIFDRETIRYLAVNDAALRLYGYTREEFLRLTTADTRHSEENAEFSTTLRGTTAYLRHRGPRRHVTKSGETIVVEIVVQDVLYEGRPARLSLTMDVTGRIRAEERLREREREFESLAENLPDIVVRFDREVRHVYVNAALERITGLPRTAFLGRTHRELPLPPELAARFDESMREVFETGQPNRLEFSIDTPSGERFFEAHHIPEVQQNGRILSALCVAHDVTERRRQEEELKRQKSLLDAVIEHSPVGITVKDAKTLRYLLRNGKVVELTGLPNAEAIGKRAEDVHPPHLAEFIREFDHKALSGASAGPVLSEIFPHRTGRMVRHLKVPVPDESGDFRYLLSITEDLTDIEAAQAALRRSEERLKQLVSVSPAAIFSFSPEPPFAATYISENVAAHVGWRASEFLSEPSFWWDRIHPEDRTAAAEALAKLTAEGEYACEYRFLHKDGRWRWMRDGGRVIRDADGAPREGVGIWIDITAERESAEERLQRVVRQRDALVREVHHRIKNHLQGIAGLLRQKVAAQPALAPLVENIVAQMKSVALVYGLQPGADAGVGLNRLLDAISESLESLMPCRIIRKWNSAQTGTLHLAADGAVPVAVAMNELLLNAIKHCERGTSVATVEVDFAERGERAEIRIANAGSLPLGFDYAARAGFNTGLELVQTLLDPKASTLAIEARGAMVETTLTLVPPLVALQPLATAA